MHSVNFHREVPAVVSYSVLLAFALSTMWLAFRALDEGINMFDAFDAWSGSSAASVTVQPLPAASAGAPKSAGR